MTQVATRHTNPLLKAVAPIKGIADINADVAADDAPSFKDLFLKQVSAQTEAANLADASAKDAKQLDLKDKAAVQAIIDQAVPADVSNQLATDPSVKPADVKLRGKSQADDDKEATADSSKAGINADISSVLVNPLVANVQPPMNKAELAAGKAEKTAEPATKGLNIGALDTQANSALADKTSTADGAKQLADKSVGKAELPLENDPLNQSRGNLQKTAGEGQDFVKTLSNSLAKSAEMNDVAAPSPSAQPVATQLASNQAVATQPNLNINTYFGAAGWDKEVNQKVVWMAGGADQSATLTLNPPDLGPVQVVINVNNDKADTTFVSDNPEVRQALQDGMDNLREMMKQSGIELGQTNINSNQQQRQSQDNAEQARFALASRASNLGSVSERDAPQLSTVKASRALPGQVDTFA